MKRDEFGTYLSVGEDGLITDIEVDPTHPALQNTCMEVFVLQTGAADARWWIAA